MRRVLVAVLALGVMSGVASAELPSSIVSPYLEIQVALAGDTFDGVKALAARISTEAGELGEHAEALQAAARTLAAAGDLNSARTAFGPLSDALITYANDTGLGDLKVAFCPMANKSWVQEGGAIANPYYGSQMLTCGAFK